MSLLNIRRCIGVYDKKNEKFIIDLKMSSHMDKCKTRDQRADSNVINVFSIWNFLYFIFYKRYINTNRDANSSYIYNHQQDKKNHDFVRITIPKVSLNQPLKKKYFFRQGLFFYLKNPTVCVLYLKLTYLSFGLK